MREKNDSVKEVCGMRRNVETRGQMSKGPGDLRSSLAVIPSCFPDWELKK